MDIRLEQKIAAEDFLKRMGWPVNSTTDEARVKWKITMKFLFPSKFNVDRAMDLYRAHEHIRTNENLDRIWIANPHLIREIQSSKFFSLPQQANQPLIVCFTAANLIHGTRTNTLSSHERELIALQALICQLDVATESMEVQRTGLNFIYDMRNCSASQFDMNLSKKILKLLQGGYPAMVKNIFIISPPKWFRVVYKATMYTAEKMRDFLITQCDYSLENIPITIGGLFDPTVMGDVRYRLCLSVVTDPRSICYSYYSSDCQPLTTKSTNNILFFNSDHQRHNNSDASPSASLVAIVALRRSHETSSQVRARKRESSSSSDSEKRRRSNESLIEEEEEPPRRVAKVLSSTPTDISDDQVQQTTALVQTNSRRLTSNTDHSNGEYETRNSMSENDNREHGVLKRDIKRSTQNAYKPLNASEFLARTPAEIKQEFRKMPNPPAKDPFAAKEDKNLDKSRYRDVIPGEATRVKLQPDSDDKHDFINANYVSGYENQEHAYIFTQGPLQSTVKDFWRMVWQENIAIVVMTTNIRESGTIKCFQYWPAESKGTLNAGLYQIHNEKSEKYASFVITTLILRNKSQPDDIRTIYHAHYLKWPDHGVPTGTKDALLFLEKVEYYRQLSTMTKSPVLLHCSAGIGRTGTFCAIDIGIRRYLETNMIDIPSVVVKMRTERAGSVQTEDQYLFAHLAMMDYIKQHQIIEQRTHESAPLSGKDSSNTSDGTQVKNNKDFSEFDDHLRKSSRMKIQGKKSHEFGQTNTLPAMHDGKTSHLTEPGTSHRGKTLSDSSTTAVHYLTPTMCTSQAEPSGQRASTDQISSALTPTGSAHHKKARK